MQVTSIAITSNVATLGVTLLEGYIPIVGALISVQGTQTATSGGSANFNITNVALTGVTIDKVTGIGTVTYALTSSNIATTTDSGMAIVPPPEIGDALTSTQKGLQFAVPHTTSADPQGKNIQWAYNYPSAPSSSSIQLEGAVFDIDAEYSVIDAVATAIVAAGGESRTVNTAQNWNFLRVKITAATGGTNPTVVAKIAV